MLCFKLVKPYAVLQHEYAHKIDQFVEKWTSAYPFMLWLDTYLIKCEWLVRMNAYIRMIKSIHRSVLQYAYNFIEEFQYLHYSNKMHNNVSNAPASTYLTEPGFNLIDLWNAEFNSYSTEIVPIKFS